MQRKQSNIITIAAGINLIANAQLESLKEYDNRKRTEAIRDAHNQRIIEHMANGEVL